MADDDVKVQSFDPSSARRLRQGAIRTAEQSRNIDTTPRGGYGAILGLLAPAMAAARAAVAAASGIESFALSNPLVRQLLANEAAAASQAAALGFGSRAAALKAAAPKVGGALAGAAAVSPALQDLPSTNKINNAPGGFVPEGPGYYFNAGRRFDNPTQAFMAEAAAERQMTEALSGHMAENPAALQARAEAAAQQADEDARAIQNGTPRGSSLLGLDAGGKIADNKNQSNFLSSLLGSVDWQGLLKVFARPEFLQPGISPAQAFVNASFAQRQAETGAAAEQQKQMLELQKEMIKKSGTDAQKLTGPVVDVINDTATASEGLEAINQYRKILSEAQVGGIGAKLNETVNSVASLFGYGGLTPAQKGQAIRQRVLASLQTAQAKGQISAADYANIEKQLSQPGKWFTNSEALNEQLTLIQSQLQSKLNLGQNTLKYFGLNPAQLSPYSNTPLFLSKRPG